MQKYKNGIWDLDDLVKNPSRQTFDKKIKEIQKQSEKFAKNKSQLKPNMSSKKFLQLLHEIEDITDDYSDMSNLSLSKTEKVDSERMEYIKNMVDTYMNKQKELKELEDELKKYKNEITPGQIGES